MLVANLKKPALTAGDMIGDPDYRGQPRARNRVEPRRQAKREINRVVPRDTDLMRLTDRNPHLSPSFPTPLFAVSTPTLVCSEPRMWVLALACVLRNNGVGHSGWLLDLGTPAAAECRTRSPRVN